MRRPRRPASGLSVPTAANIKRVRRLTRVAVAAVVLMMMAVTGDLMLSPEPTARAVDAKAVRVTSSNLITDPATGQPTVVLALPVAHPAQPPTATVQNLSGAPKPGFRLARTT